MNFSATSLAEEKEIDASISLFRESIRQWMHKQKEISDCRFEVEEREDGSVFLKAIHKREV